MSEPDVSAREVGSLVMQFVANVNAVDAQKVVAHLVELKKLPATEVEAETLLATLFTICPSANNDVVLASLSGSMPFILRKLCRDLPRLIELLRPYQAEVAAILHAIAVLLKSSPTQGTELPAAAGAARQADPLLRIKFDDDNQFATTMLLIADSVW